MYSGVAENGRIEFETPFPEAARMFYRGRLDELGGLEVTPALLTNRATRTFVMSGRSSTRLFASRGTEFTLTFPGNNAVGGTLATMTLVTNLAGLPFAGRVLGAVQISLDDEELLGAAELSLTFDTNTDRRQVVSFMAEVDGSARDRTIMKPQAVFAFFVLVQTLAAAPPQWPQFRGPNGSGVAEDARPPIHFGAEANNGTTVSFTAPARWRPAQIKILFPFAPFTLPVAYPQHACVVARTDPYIVGALREVTPDNNEAQSNYSWVATTTSSPASREVTVIIAENTLPRPAIVSFQIHQPNPLFRVYLDHRWVRLAPGAKTPIPVMIESLLGDPRYEDLVKEHPQGEQRITSTVWISALGDTGEACAPTVLGGATILAITGRATRFDAFTANVDMAQGTVVAADTGAGVDGKILISIRNADPNDPTPEIIKEGFVQSGAFQVLLNTIPPGSVVQGHYLGQNQMAPSDSQPITATP